MNKGYKNTEGGFLRIILFIIVIIIVMSYFHLSLGGIASWFANAFASVVHH
jgi:cell shape-determining protein MreC